MLELFDKDEMESVLNQLADEALQDDPETDTHSVEQLKNIFTKERLLYMWI